MPCLFISGTDTNVGKTFVSAQILKELIRQGWALQDLAYYKPIQCGLNETDSAYISQEIKGLPTYNTYALDYPAAPSFAAECQGIEIDIGRILTKFHDIKRKHSWLIVEGAGGLAVPIHKTYLVSNLIHDLDIDLLLVISTKLGTINHSLLSLEHIEARKLKLKGIYPNPESNSKSLPHERSAPRIINEIKKHHRIFNSIAEIVDEF